jgi:hypothetical protein
VQVLCLPYKLFCLLPQPITLQLITLSTRCLCVVCCKRAEQLHALKEWLTLKVLADALQDSSSSSYVCDDAVRQGR